MRKLFTRKVGRMH